jgi:hypothetical protein
MILEGIVTTVSPKGDVNIAPMGPQVGPNMECFTLKPFRTAQTYRNLLAQGEGVLHVTDDVLLFARAAVGRLDPLPSLTPAARVRGFVLLGACHYYEFRVTAVDDTEMRARLECEVVHRGRFRDFFGFNRAKHAVVEACILATRIHLIPLAELESEFQRLRVPVDKTGGPVEHEAFAFLADFVATTAADSTSRQALGKP